MQEVICDYVQQEEKLADKVEQYWIKRNEVIHNIEKLKCVEYDFLYKLYVQGKTLQQIADDYDRSYSWATTVHARALKSLQVILDTAR